MLTTEEIASKIRGIIRENLEMVNEIGEIGLDDALVTLGVNSIIFIKIIIGIESEFDIEFGDEELDFAKFSTLRSVVENLQKKI